MGIYDREYIRREGPSFLGSLADSGKICKWLILANVICFVVQLLTMRSLLPPELAEAMPFRGPRVSGWFTEWFLLDADKVLHGQVWRLLTCAFLHSEDNILHIVFNMLVLWWFGKDVESIYGPWEFLAIYLTGAAVSSGMYVAAYVAGLNGPLALGASGAVTTVMVLCALHFPTRIIYLFFFLPVPMLLAVAIYVAVDVFGLVGGGGRVAFSAHLGGALFGFVYYSSKIRMLNLLPDLRAWRCQRGRPRLRVYRDDESTPTPVSVAAGRASTENDEHLEAKVDAVLEKLSRHGRGSLTESELQILQRAGEIYKRKRT